MKRRVLILCTGNSARSQMAEGLINHLRAGQWEAFSAGTHPTGYVHPEAVAAMREIGVDISGGRSKSVDEFQGQRFELVITVCDDAAEECPVWLGPGKRQHIRFPDPARGNPADFRSVRDEMVQRLLPSLDRYSENEDQGDVSHSEG